MLAAASPQCPQPAATEIEHRKHDPASAAGRAAAARRTDRRPWRSRAASRAMGMRPSETPSPIATGFGSRRVHDARIEPGAGQIGREQSTRCQAHASVRVLLEALRSEDGVVGGDEQQRDGRPQQPQPDAADPHGERGEHQRAPVSVARREQQASSIRRQREPSPADWSPRSGQSQRQNEAEQRPGRDVEEVVLIGGEHRDADQREPDVQRPLRQRAAGAARRARHRMTSRAMCSDGAWLKGLSKLVSASNMKPARPSVSGCGNVKLSGNRMKQATATTCAVSRRRACASSSARVAQTKSDSAVERVDRPVRNDRPVDERDARVPTRTRSRGHALAAPRAIGGAVGQVEERRQEQRASRWRAATDAARGTAAGPIAHERSARPATR